jgi:two-component system, NarL family, nitrate/nitrite response regulator NarL
MSMSAVSPLRILLVDDHAIMRDGLRLLIETTENMCVVGEATNRAQALQIAASERPDLILLDLDLGRESGLDFLQELLGISNQSKVLVLTGVRDSDLHYRAVRLGAMGVVLKEQAGKVLMKAIEKVCAGEVWMERSMTANLLDQIRKAQDSPKVDRETVKIASLTNREREVVALIGLGMGTKQISARLFISEKTVRNHLASIYSKLELSDRLELAIYAARHGLVPSPPTA